MSLYSLHLLWTLAHISSPATNLHPSNSNQGGIHIPCNAIQLPGLTGNGNGLNTRVLSTNALRSNDAPFDPVSERSTEGNSHPIPGSSQTSGDNGSSHNRAPNRRYLREDNRYRSGRLLILVFIHNYISSCI